MHKFALVAIMMRAIEPVEVIPSGEKVVVLIPWADGIMRDQCKVQAVQKEIENLEIFPHPVPLHFQIFWGQVMGQEVHTFMLNHFLYIQYTSISYHCCLCYGIHRNVAELAFKMGRKIFSGLSFVLLLRGFVEPERESGSSLGSENHLKSYLI